MAQAELPSGTVTLLFTDIEGSTALLKQLRDRYGEVLADHRRIMRAAFDAHGGREIDTQGDAFFVAFARAKEAVAAAVDAQLALASHVWPEGVAVRVRMGIHTGEPVLGSEGYHGLGLHRGARICSAGHGGQILVSNATRELVEDELIDGVELMDLGDKRLKDIDRPERLSQVVYPGMPSSFPPLKTADAVPFEGRENELADAVAVRFGWVRTRRRPVALVAGLVAAAVVVVVLLTRDGGEPISVQPNSLAVLSPDGKSLKASVPAGTSPGGVAIGEGSLWVTNTGESTVSRVKDGEVVQTIPVGTGPVGVAVAGGFVWVANSLDGTVSQIDPRKAGGAEIGRVKVGNQPNSLAAGDGVVWVANSTDHTLSRIDTETGRAGKPIRVGTGADAIAIGEGRVWVTSFSGATVTEIDPQTGRVLRPISVGYGPSSVAVGAGAVWVVNALDGTLSKIDPERSSVAATLQVGREPHSVAARGNDVWVTDEAGVLVRVDARATAVEQRIRLGSGPGALAVGGRGVYVAIRSAGPAHRGGTLRIASREGIEGNNSLDPGVAYSDLTWPLANLVADGLVAFRRTSGTTGGQIVPDLATSLPVPTDGGRTWTFPVRRGVRYSNGDTVVPSDIRRGIERAMSFPYSPGPVYFAVLEGAADCKPQRRCDLSRGIDADDAAGRITFHLTEPDPDFLYKLAMPVASAVPRTAPSHAVNAGLPGTGPYRVASVTKPRIVLTRNPRFQERSAAAQPVPYPDRIDVRLGVPEDEQLRLVERGKADLAFDATWADPGEIARLQRLRASQMHVNPSRTVQFAFLNTELAPFDDVRARRALNLAVDRRALVGRTGIPSCQVLPHDVLGYERYCPYRRDLDQARRLVSASGTKGAKVDVWSPPDVAPERYMAGIARALRAIGYRARLHVSADTNAHFVRASGGRMQVGFFGWVTDYPSPATIIQPLLGCGEEANFSKLCDRTIQADIRRAARLQSTNPGEAARRWARVDHALTDLAPWLPLRNVAAIAFVSDRVGNVQYNPQWGVLLDQLWVQ